MSLITHLETLDEKHARLESMIMDEMHRPLPDFKLITELKKQKLRVKEESMRLAHIRSSEKRDAV